jgi:hypothetical protein
MVRVGHKYAREANLLESLQALTVETHQKYNARIHTLSAPEGRAWEAWKTATTLAIAKIPKQKPPWLDAKITSGIRDLKQIQIVTKLADIWNDPNTRRYLQQPAERSHPLGHVHAG